LSSVSAFEGAEDIRRAWARGLAPDSALTVSEWADRHRVLSSRAASEAGPYRTNRTPYMRAIMDALSPASPVQRVVFMKSAQVGATEAGNNWIGFCMHRAPGPFLAVQPTVDLAKRLSQQRIEPLIEESPDLRELVLPSRSRDSGNTVLAKRFPGGQLILTGANSAVGLRLVAVDGVGLDVVLAQLVREAVGTDARPAEHQHLFEVARLDEVGQQLALFLARHRMHHVRHQLGHRVARGHLHLGGIAQQRLHQPAYFVREGGGKQQVLALLGQQRDDAADVGQEPHVEHAIGLVQRQDADLIEHHGLALHVIEQPPGGRHEDFDAAPQLQDLRVHVRTAVHHGAAQRQVLAVLSETLLDLDRQLARRREHQHAHLVARRRGAGARVRRKALQDR
jgi:hypothetical protein